MPASRPQHDPFVRLVQRFGRAKRIASAMGVLSWDAQTMMPKGGAETRSEQVAALQETVAEIIAAPETADLVEESETLRAALDPVDQADLDEMARIHREIRPTPPALLAERARLAQRLRPVWEDARARSDFRPFAEPFDALLRVLRDIAALRAEASGLSPYDALMEGFDPGVGTGLVDPIFAELEARLPPLLAEVEDRQAGWPAPRPIGPASIERQAELSQRLVRLVGHDDHHIRIDTAVHPFSSSAPGDLRITTRFNVDDPLLNVRATLHEAGHAMYEHNLPRDLAFRACGQSRGMSMHESQSLGLEMGAGRSRAFMACLGPLLRSTLGVDPEAAAPENVLAHIRRLERGFIRVDADEISYPLHVILRYRLEQALLSGALATADLPLAWDDGFEALFGRRPPDLARGCLQDIHWASGLFGYFPNYAIGAVLANQLLETAETDEPDLLAPLGDGDFGPYVGWMKARVHARASLAPFGDIVVSATGRPLSADAMLTRLKRRYLEEPAPGEA